MVISEQWSSYKADDINKAKFVKETLLDDIWWDNDDYILSSTTHIYDVLRKKIRIQLGFIWCMKCGTQ